MVSSLTHTLGLENLQLAEDAVQDALLKAMRNWPFAGIPQNPSAWLTQVARNYALDVVRRAQNFRTKENEIALLLESRADRGPQSDRTYFDDEIRDNQLQMMFACCHSALPQEAQVALTLKTLCGFGEQEIAAAFLISSPAVAKRLVRARQQSPSKFPLAKNCRNGLTLFCRRSICSLTRVIKHRTATNWSERSFVRKQFD